MSRIVNESSSSFEDLSSVATARPTPLLRPHQYHGAPPESSETSEHHPSGATSDENVELGARQGSSSGSAETIPLVAPSAAHSSPASPFGLDVVQLEQISGKYQTRVTVEDLDYLLSLAPSTESIASHLKSNARDGLLSDDPDDLARRIEAFGPNVLPSKKSTSFMRLVWDASKDLMLRILIVAGVLSIILGVGFGEQKNLEWIEGFAIFMAVVIVVLVTATNDYLKEKQFKKLCEQEEKLATVTRCGAAQQISTKLLVVGDLVKLEMGDEVPADCIVASCRSIKIDESSITGESDTISKRPLEECLKMQIERKDELLGEGVRHHVVDSPVLLSGTTVTTGSAEAIVVAVGVHSQVGKLFQKLGIDTEPTPLQNKLNGLARSIGKYGLIAACFTLFVLILEFWIMYALQDKTERPSGSEIANEHVNYLIESITIVVVAVPEGLPLAVTISLAFSVNRMLKDQNYVRRLAACETMGGANEICSDKTGTLTKNRMTVEAFWNGSHLEVDLDPKRKPESVPTLPVEHMRAMVEVVALNSTAYLEVETKELKDGQKKTVEIVKHVGSATECALLEFIQALGHDYTQLRRNLADTKHLDLPPGLIVDASGVVLRVPFSSERKMMSTVIPSPLGNGMLRALVKGASERVLRLCTHRVSSSGAIQSMGPSHIERVEQAIIHNLATKALRTICLAYIDFKLTDIPNWRENQIEDVALLMFEKDLTCVGIAGIRDPVRDEVPAAVRRCQVSGIRVRMVTGDNIETAKQIALKCNIYRPEAGGIAMHGPEFLELVGGVVCENCQTHQCDCPLTAEAVTAVKSKKKSKKSKKGQVAEDEETGPVTVKVRKDVLGRPEEFEKIVDRLEVLARSQPNDKYALVTGLRNRGAVVAVTGDGTNDAPALRKADVGFAMGITGKEVAKQAADIVLLDDNFESIVRAVMWGRNIYDNIRRFLQFQITVNIVAVSTAFVGAVVLRDSPLNAVELLWVNLIMDTFAALALATEPPDSSLLDRPPHSRTEYLISKTMWSNIITQAIYQLLVMGMILFTGECWLWEKQFAVSDENYDKYPDYTWYDTSCDWVSGYYTVKSGRRFKPFSSEEDYKQSWFWDIGPSRHYTYVFNIFVWMQLFNIINARKINPGEKNIFKGLFKNWMWLGIVSFIILGQAVIVQFGSYAFAVHLEGLAGGQWGISMLFGLGGLTVGFLVRFIPNRATEAFMPQAGQREVNPMEEPTSIALASRGRISSERLSHRLVLSPETRGLAVRTSVVGDSGGLRQHQSH